jgi:putative ABC transport system permease protein
MLNIFSIKKELTIDAFRNVRAIWRRSILAISGIMIGTTSFLIVVNISESAREQSMRLFEGAGPDVLAVYISLARGHHNPGMAINDVISAPNQLSVISEAAPLALAGLDIALGSRKVNANVMGTNNNLSGIVHAQIDAGRFLSTYDSARTFAVLGNTLAQQLAITPSQLQAGITLRLGSYLYKVIGVLRAEIPNPLFPVDLNNSVIVPIIGFQRVAPDNITAALMRRAPGIDEDSARSTIIDYFKNRKPSVSVEVRSAKQILVIMNGQRQVYNTLLMAVGIASLLMGSAGIFSIMLMSVNERRHEIGLRLALGARSQDIRATFLAEAMILSFGGGITGIAIGSATSSVFARFFGWGSGYYVVTALVAFLAAMATGLCSGIYPAMKAARLDPIAALRL